MCTRAKGHTGVKCDHHVVRPGVDFYPFGAHHQPAAQADGLVMDFPGIGPIFLVDHPVHRGWHRIHQAHVPQSGFQQQLGLFDAAICREIGANRQTLRRFDLTLIPGFRWHVFLLDSDALVAVTLQQIRDGFGSLTVDAQCDFHPAHITLAITCIFRSRVQKQHLLRQM